jgi:hypothetical protein
MGLREDLAAAIGRHDAYLERVSAILAYGRRNAEPPREFLLDEEELRSLDHAFEVLAARLLKTPTVHEDVWMPPVRFSYKTGYAKEGKWTWLEAFHRGLTQSRAFFQSFQGERKERTEVTKYDIRIDHVTGPVNVLSHLERVAQSVQVAPGLSTERRDTLVGLLGDLKAALASIPPSHSGDAEVVAEQAEAIATELQRPQPRTASLKIKGSGLIEAAKAIGTIVPTALEIAKKIADFVAGPLS